MASNSSKFPVPARYMAAARLGALLLYVYSCGSGAILAGTSIAANSGAESSLLQDKQQGEPKKPTAPIEQKSSGSSSPNIVGNNNTVTVRDPKIEAKLDEIKRLLEAQQGDRATSEKLLARYPLGYVIFEADYENMVLPYKAQKILDKWDFDWSRVKLTDISGNRAEITMPTIRDKKGTVTFDGNSMTGEKKLGPFPPNVALFTDGTIVMKAEILAIRDRGIVFLIGFTPFVPPPKH